VQDLAYWIRDTGMTLGFIPRQVYAQQQGIGFRGLEPLLPIWRAFRNLAYLLLALAMIVVGFLVMMRKQIDPKTVVTVQNSLPRIVIALILITFSYAIVGLLVDVMYLIMAFLATIIQGTLPSNNLPNTISPINYANPGYFDFVKAIFFPVWDTSISSPLRYIFQNNNTTSGLWNILGGISGLLLSPVMMLILGLAFLFAFIRILLLLLNCYIQILLAVLLGPLQILMDVFPGTNGFTTWIKNVFANLVVFPITAFMLMIGNSISQHLGTKALWTAPFLPQIGSLETPAGELTIGGIGGLAEGLIALGFLLSIPSIANGIKETLKAKSPIEAGPGVIFGPLGKAAGTGLSAGYQFSMIASFLGGKKGPPQQR
jgi:hypothetical protein